VFEGCKGLMSSSIEGELTSVELPLSKQASLLQKCR
jgi:hypothetical protein